MATFYITTAIDYANSTPHLGTAYEKIGADVIARYRRMCGDDVFFLMGNDEHSQNVRKRAEELHLDPKAYCDQMAKEFQTTWKELGISHSKFIQTSSPEHHKMVREIATRIYRAKDSKGRPLIYKSPYEGHYCISCEAYYKEKDLVNGVCPNHKIKPEWVHEENYFFRLSEFTGQIQRLINEKPKFIRPQSRKNEILKLLGQGLEDVSISRSNTTWGVKLPFDESAVAYVWFDALINYMSALGELEGETYKRYWPASLHVIGKDITRFHCVIWPAMLMAAGLPVSESVWAHGFVYILGEKMSKSRGNVADPRALAKTYSSDVLRYHLMREISWDQDGDFTEERLITRYNADLANDLGNLVNRTLAMVEKFIGKNVSKPASSSISSDIEAIQKVLNDYRANMDEYSIAAALDAVWTLVVQANQRIDRDKPWAMAKDASRKLELERLFYILLEHLRWVSFLLTPVMPQKMAELRKQLGIEEASTFNAEKKPGEYLVYTVTLPSPLFPRLETVGGPSSKSQK